MLDEQLIAEAKVPGLRPTQQQRSRELVVRLVNEGLALLDDHDFDTLSVEALCARCSATVGSFYARFDSKDAFIEALQQLVVEDRRRDLAEGVPEVFAIAHCSSPAFKLGVRN